MSPRRLQVREHVGVRFADNGPASYVGIPWAPQLLNIDG